MTPQEAEAQMRHLSGKIQSGIEELAKRSREWAQAEMVYRQAKAQMWLQESEGTAAFRAAQVDGKSADLRYARDLADGLRDSAREALRARRTELSALQSVLAAYKAESEMSRYGPPQEGP